MRNFKSVLYSCIVLLLMIGCQKISNGDIEPEFFEQAEKVNFESLEQGFYGNIDQQNSVITTERQFKDFWSSLYSNRKPLPEIPKVDFSAHQILVSVMDTKPTGGYAVTITEVGLLNGKLGVRVKKVKPGTNCFTTQALTTPFHIVKIDKSSNQVEFFEEEATVDCSE